MLLFTWRIAPPPLLDVLLAVYMLWRAGDARGRVSSLGAGA